MDLIKRNSKSIYSEEETEMNVEWLDNGEVVDTGYGFVNNKGIEVCSDSELVE